MASTRVVVHPAQFLSSPAAIRSAIVRAIVAATSVDIAVAFVGEDWWSLLGALAVPVRLVCWLSSTNTNPYAVEQMLGRPGFSVRQLDRMHAKVYLAYGAAPCIIVGSANISGAALSADDGVGQYETAVWLPQSAALVNGRQWFETTWQSAVDISATDLEAAKTAWSAAHVAGRARGHVGLTQPPEGLLPGDWVPPSELEELAALVADFDLINGSDFGDEWAFMHSLDPASLDEHEVNQVFHFLVKWAGHPGVFRPFTEQPIERLRQAFAVVFDESVDVRERLRSVAPGGDAKIRGLGLPAWTIMLQWRLPSLYPPHDRRTVRFLRDFYLAQYAPLSLTPIGYSRWCAFARELSARLQLPTPGHVDRVVWEYTKDKVIA